MKLKNVFIVMILAAFLVLNVGCQKEAIGISNMWIRLPLNGMDKTAGFLTIANNGLEDLVLIGAKSDICQKIELHTMTMDGEVMKMQQVESFEAKAGQKIELKSHGNHLMILGINKEITEKDKVDVELEFKNGKKIKVTMEVKKDY